MRKRIYVVSRLIICATCLSAIGSPFIPVANNLHLALDILARTYLIFLGTVMAHESVHGHLGRTRRANFWWGRIALLPSMVPFTNFRRTHQLHHAYTNIPDRDPDHFMKSRNFVDLALRAIAMPHHWFFWLRKHGRVKHADLRELLLNYAGIVVLYSVVLMFVGPTRLFWGMAPPLILVSLLRWKCSHTGTGNTNQRHNTKSGSGIRLTSAEIPPRVLATARGFGGGSEKDFVYE